MATLTVHLANGGNIGLTDVPGTHSEIAEHINFAMQNGQPYVVIGRQGRAVINTRHITHVFISGSETPREPAIQG